MLESAAILYSKGKVALQADGAAKFPASCPQRDVPTMTNSQTTFPLWRVLQTGSFVAATVFSLMGMAVTMRAQEAAHSLELSRTVRRNSARFVLARNNGNARRWWVHRRRRSHSRNTKRIIQKRRKVRFGWARRRKEKRRK